MEVVEGGRGLGLVDCYVVVLKLQGAGEGGR